MKLLIADDEQDMVKSLQNMLIDEGYSVDAVFEGKSALKLLEHNQYDFVFVDHNMPF